MPAPKRQSPKQMQEAVDAFNAKNPIGSTILVWPGSKTDGKGQSVAGINAEIVEPGAYVMGGHTAVVQVRGRGCIALTHAEGAR